VFIAFISAGRPGVRLARMGSSMKNAPLAASERGFTLIEVMMTVMLVGIIGSMAVFQFGAARPGMVADGAMRTLMGQLNQARELAVAQRRRVQLTFDVANHRFTVTRLDEPAGTTVIAQAPFEGGVKFGLVAGVPDTPDAFGNSSSTSFGSAQVILFNTEGMLVDGAGNPLNGTVFLNIPDMAQSYRAVTVLGSVGRVRGYRWNGTTWTRA
jgi:prepilin-type N-terminal cleavage/methylation domain-containing protein